MEKREKRQKQKETFKKVLRYIKKYWFYLILSILLAVITVVLTLYIPILIGDAVDEIVGAGHVDFAAIFVILKHFKRLKVCRSPIWMLIPTETWSAVLLRT